MVEQTCRSELGRKFRWMKISGSQSFYGLVASHTGRTGECHSLRRPNNQTIGGFLLQRFAKVPVHAATILKCAEAAIILERIRELTVGEYGRGQFCEATAKWWAHSTPWISIRRVQEIIKRLVDEGYAIRVQNYEAGTGHKTSSMYAMTAKGLEILSIQKVSDLVNPEAIEANDKEIKAYLEANAGSRAYHLAQDSAQPTAGFRARDARDSAHLLDSSSNRQYEQTNTREHPAAPEPAAPKKVKTKSQSSTVREQELAQKLLDIWNSACDRAKLTRRSLPKCLKFPVDAMPAMKKYMKAYTDDEIIQLVTDGSRSVQKNDFYHERRYGFVNLMRNLGANANLSAPAERSTNAPDGASPIPAAPSPKSSGLFDFDQDEAAAERKKLLDYEASLPVPEFPC